MDVNILKDIPPWEWPENAGEILMGSLRNRQSTASDRIVAADLLGDLVVMDDEIANLLLSIVRNAEEPEKLRGRAAISLGPVLEQTDIDKFDDEFAEPPISEKTFDQIRETLRQIYMDQGTPKELRRRILEASVRAPQDWHKPEILTAYASTDEDWKLTATFCMRYVAGFDDQIIEMLTSRNPQIHYEAVRAAGNWELDAAWPHVAELVASPGTEKWLLLAAIEAAASIRPREAGPLLIDLADSEDEDIAEAADDALVMAERASDDYDSEEEDEFDDDDEDEGEDAPF